MKLIASCTFIPLAAFGLLITGGCGSPPAPVAEPEPERLSYVEALTIYNQETEALQRLKKQRESLQQTLTPSGGGLGSTVETGELVGDLLRQATEAQAEIQETIGELTGTTGSREGDAEESPHQDPLEALSDQLRESQQPNEQEPNEQEREEINKRIAEIDEEIAAQEQRVARAKADRDAAEKNRPSGQPNP